MSGNIYDSGLVSSLGGGVPGKVEAAYGNTLKGSQVSINRHKLRKAFKTNKVQLPSGSVSASCGPFRSAFQLGDPLGRKSQRCGGCNQSNKDGLSNSDCNRETNGVTPLDVPLSGSHGTFVSDSSLFTQFKHLKAINLTYNDKSAGGSSGNTPASALNRIRG